MSWLFTVLNLWQTLKFYSGGLYLLIRSVPSKMKRIPLLTGKKLIAVFGSTEGESSDDSLVDLVSAKNWSIAELPKHCFYHEMVFQSGGFGRQSHVTFYERFASSQICFLPDSCLLQRANLWTFKNKKNWSPGKMMSILKWLGCGLAILPPKMKW